MTPALASNLTSWFTSQWHQGPRVFIAPTARDLPVPAPKDARGLFWKGEVHVVAQQPLDSMAQALMHEAVGHYGLRQWLGAEWPHFMRHIQNGVRSGDSGLQRLQSHIRKAYVDDDGRYALTVRQEADEITAYAAEGLVCYDTGTIRPKQAWAKALQAAKGRFVREGLCIEGSVSKEELEGALFLAAKHLEGWPWHPVRRCIGRAWGACCNMLGMSKPNPYKPPMSMEESQRLLDGAKQHELQRKYWASNFWLSVGILKILGVIAVAALMFYALGAAIGSTAAIVLVCLVMFFHDRIDK